ncbi:mitochondrial glycoprotein [Irpex rosettiformis]|uniref:Mitochondrial glycoprotein n=1 Tax=Irpex rosettiformis TaxID=378272 RepID=A0ACB8U7W6_9APHY|nr:mitochondrial glycoprotein [Irpex rosettiformis]
MSAIRALRQVAGPSCRALATRSFVTSTRVALPAFRVAATLPTATRAFSVSARRFGEGAADVALSQKLAEELQYESEASQEAEPDFLKSFNAQGVWKIEDVAGNDEVTFVRKFGNETIRLIFSIADIQTAQEQQFQELEEGEEASEDEPAHAYPIRCSISINKGESSIGALTVDAMCQDGAFVADNISFYQDGKLATELTPEADWKRRGLYIGPQFDTLDVTVQEEFEKFLAERGVNDSLAVFIPEYAEYKEQKEYVSWLKNVKAFVDA